MDRLTHCFNKAKSENRAALITYFMAGDPDLEASKAIFRQLIENGADVIEIGVPFTDPMAEGTTIQLACQRALAAGTNLSQVLELAGELRKDYPETPLILMGYANPIFRYGAAQFCQIARERGIDGLIVVDLPPEEDGILCIPAREAGLHFIRLATPTTDPQRLPTVLNRASGFIYYISITGITGAAAPELSAVSQDIARLQKNTDLPIAVGFGIKTPEQAKQFAAIADGVVVGSALVQTVAEATDPKTAQILVGQLTAALRAALSR